MKKQYRYIMNGMFCGTDGEEYEITIPSHLLYDLEDEAMRDESFGYRFILMDDEIGPEIVVFERENFEVVKDGDEKYLEQWVEGDVIKTYTFEEFKNAGGYIRMLKPELKNCGFIDSNTDFIDTDKTFKDIFPNMRKWKLRYIDTQAYYVDEISEVNYVKEK